MYNSLHTFQITLLTLLLVCGSGGAAAAEPRLYDVEVIIFSQNSQSDQGGSGQASDRHDGRDRGSFSASQFTELSSSHFKLNPVKYTLRKSAGYSILYHRAWRQPAYSSSNASAYPVHALSGGGHNRIEGTVRLVRGRYLHLDMDLLLMQLSGSAPGVYSDSAGSSPAYRIKEKRRIKSKELHYFDHPRFGVLARVTPYQPPEQTVPETPATAPESVNDDAPAAVKPTVSPQ